MDDNLQVLTDKTNPFYCLEHFLLKINFQLSNLSNEKPDSIEDFAQFLHEYTHYLQTITTINGISSLVSYIDKLLHMTIDIAINIAMENDNSQSIIKSYEREFKIFYYRQFWNKPTKNFLVNSKTPFFIIQNVYNPIHKNQTREVYIYNIKDKLFYHVSTKMLRENMAMMAYFSIRGIGQDSIMDHVAIYPTEDKPYCCKYWLLFSYFFYKYPQIKNSIKFTYFFCELALMVINTGEFIEKLLNDIDEIIKTHKYDNENVFFDLLWKKQVDYISRNSDIVITLINTIKKSLSKIVNDNEFYLPILKILELAEAGIKYKQQNCMTIYDEKMDQKWVQKMAKIFYSPIIFQPNGIFSMLSEDEIYQNLLGILFGVTIISQKIIHNERIIYCPFLEEIPICKLSNSDIHEICATHPLDIPAFENGGCLLYNTALILGLLGEAYTV